MPTLKMGALAAGLGLFLAAPLFLMSSAAYADETQLDATYSVSIAGLPIGRVEVTARFTRTGYAAAITASVSGITRLVSDARATLLGSGKITENRVFPTLYHLQTSERDLETSVRMSMRNGAITDLLAIPPLRPAADRVPLSAEHRRGIVDPVGALLIVMDDTGLNDGAGICRRTLNIFDGWQRFDIKLTYKQARLITGINGAYDGRVVVCRARFIPVAGHRRNRQAIRYMAANERLEIAYAPVADMPFLVPHHILIGTKYGDLVISSTRFLITDEIERAGN